MAESQDKKNLVENLSDKDLIALSQKQGNAFNEEIAAKEAAAKEAEPKGLAAKMKEALVAGCNKMSQMSSAIRGVKSKGKDQGRGM